MRIDAFQGMDIQDEQPHHGDTKLQPYAASDARRPHTRVLQHHGHLPYDVWNESQPYRPASIPLSKPTAPSTAPHSSTPSGQLQQYTVKANEDSDALTGIDLGTGISYATRCHTPKPSSTACTIPDPYRPLHDFDRRSATRYPNEPARNLPQQRQRRQRPNKDRHKKSFLLKESHQALRQEILLSCYADSLPPREQFSEPRGYLDEHNLYTTCEAPLPGIRLNFQGIRLNTQKS
jgi:hypothetical protein